VSGNANTLRAASFYGQALLTGMFLIEVSGDPRILAPISSAIAGGSSFSDWLAEAGPRHGLPDNLAALQTAWETWSGTLLDRAQATQWNQYSRYLPCPWPNATNTPWTKSAIKGCSS